MSITQPTQLSTAAMEAYESLAGAYDVLTAAYPHDAWLERIERAAVSHGLCGNRLLDIACGTGKSFLPLLARGYETTGCDLSAEMVRIARTKAPEADLFVADMRELPSIGDFDLITCLDDAVNYLLEESELLGFLGSISRNLSPGGIAVFDVNSAKTYAHGFVCQWHLDAAEAFLAWHGRPRGDLGEDRYEADLVVFSPDGDAWTRSQSLHQQRHWAEAEVRAAAAASGLRVVALHGQRRGAVLEPLFAETEHEKALYFLAPDTERW